MMYIKLSLLLCSLHVIRMYAYNICIVRSDFQFPQKVLNIQI